MSIGDSKSAMSSHYLELNPSYTSAILIDIWSNLWVFSFEVSGSPSNWHKLTCDSGLIFTTQELTWQVPKTIPLGRELLHSLPAASGPTFPRSPFLSPSRTWRHILWAQFWSMAGDINTFYHENLKKWLSPVLQFVKEEENPERLRVNPTPLPRLGALQTYCYPIFHFERLHICGEVVRTVQQKNKHPTFRCDKLLTFCHIGLSHLSVNCRYFNPIELVMYSLRTRTLSDKIIVYHILEIYNQSNTII